MFELRTFKIFQAKFYLLFHLILFVKHPKKPIRAADRAMKNAISKDFKWQVLWMKSRVG